MLGFWQHCDRTGWDAACVTDHFMPNTADRVGDTLECWTALAALAARTERLRVGTIVSGNTYRHPALLAKMAANVDIISGGRLICGMGAGWQENEHRAYGMDFYTTRERLERLDEACRVLKALWTEARANYKGRFYRLDDAPLMPKAVQKPHPELMIGGGGEKVTLRIAAQHADHWNVWGGPETLTHKGADPRRALREGRARSQADPALGGHGAGLRRRQAGVERIQQSYMKRMGADEAKARDTVLAGSVSQIRDKLGKLKAAGVGMLFIPTFLLPTDRHGALDRFMSEIAPAFRS